MGQKELADLLEDFHRRRALGERPCVTEYRGRAGEDFEEFVKILETEAELDAAMDHGRGGPEFPMPFGEYTLLGELGRGAVGVVYKAMHRTLGRTVALKILKTGFDTHPVAIERFRREARACAQIRHDSIVEVYEAGEHEGRHFYAMALMEGKSLKEAARDGELPSWPEFAENMADVVDALNELHERGIVHRDIKPSNIMLEESGRLVLADFGLARTVASEKLTQTGESLGTPLYMSPEQLLGDQKKIDGRTDVYAMGATLYEVVSGRSVFEAEDVSSLMRQIIAERPRPLRELAPDAPEGLRRIIMKAIEKRRCDRYESAAEFRDDLRSFARGGEVKGRPVSGSRRALRAVRRNFMLITSVAAVILIVAAFLAFRPPAPVTLTVASMPKATLFVDGEDQGQTTVEVEVKPGKHVLVLRREGFVERRLEVDLDADRDLEKVLTPADATDAETLTLLAESLGVSMEKWEKMERHRGGGSDGSIHLLLPRGKVRLQDATRFRIRVDDGFLEDGAVVFRADDKEIARRAVDDDWPEDIDATVEMPAEVIAALERGAEISWGFVSPSGGGKSFETFALVDDPTGALRDRLAEVEGPARDLILAQACLADGLAAAAYALAEPIAREQKSAPAYAIMRAALRRLGLEGGPLWEDLIVLSDR